MFYQFTLDGCPTIAPNVPWQTNRKPSQGTFCSGSLRNSRVTRRRPLRTWKSWSVASATNGNRAPTWDEWCARLRRTRSGEKRQQACQQDNVPFSQREIARLSFVRWLYLRGSLDPAQTDNA